MKLAIGRDVSRSPDRTRHTARATERTARLCPFTRLDWTFVLLESLNNLSPLILTFRLLRLSTLKLHVISFLQ